jgi:TetR/AcrR family transcriptional regulator, regulator of biofilm formation and stress response
MVASRGDRTGRAWGPQAIGVGTTGNWYICTTMTVSAPNGTRPRGTARREALLDAVLRVVAEAGVDAVTHRRVAEAAGLPLASTTYWFESKEQMLTAALERAADRDIERLNAFLGETPERAADPLGLAVRAILGPNEDSGQTRTLLATYTLMLEAARQPALREVTTRWTEAYMEALPPLLAAAGSRHGRSDAELLLAAADGLLIEQLASDDTSDLAPRLRRLADALVKA